MIPDSENRGQCKLYLHYVNDSSFRCRYSIYIYIYVYAVYPFPPPPPFFLLISFHSPLGCHSVCGLPVLLLYIFSPERECTDDAMVWPDQSQCRHFQVYPKLAPRKFPLSLSSPCILQSWPLPFSNCLREKSIVFLYHFFSALSLSISCFSDN
jgi:hypothetical protein